MPLVKPEKAPPTLIILAAVVSVAIGIAVAIIRRKRRPAYSYKLEKIRGEIIR